jgi:hypothetical protein
MSANDPLAGNHAAIRVLRWADFYTRGLPPEVRDVRRDEICSDLHDEAMDARRRGIAGPALARSIRRRAIRGSLADLDWRRRQLLVAGISTRAKAARFAFVGIAVLGVAVSALLLMVANSEARTASAEDTQIVYSGYAVRGEVAYLNRLAREVREDRVLADDPPYAVYLAEEHSALQRERKREPTVLAQFQGIRKEAAADHATAARESVAAICAVVASALLLAACGAIAVFDPRTTRSNR